MLKETEFCTIWVVHHTVQPPQIIQAQAKISTVRPVFLDLPVSYDFVCNEPLHADFVNGEKIAVITVSKLRPRKVMPRNVLENETFIFYLLPNSWVSWKVFS